VNAKPSPEGLGYSRLPRACTIVEECSKPDEADDITAHYRSIITRIRQQMEAQP